MKMIFFGTSNFSVTILERLKNKGVVPSLIITTEDKPKGRKLVLTPPPVKTWATENNITLLQPKTLKDSGFLTQLKNLVPDTDIAIVASYGKIIPKDILDFPKAGMLNIHPSLLPKYRGASPIQSVILNENKTGITIIKLDEEMDHGPIVSQKETTYWNTENIPTYTTLEKKLGEESAEMLLSVLPQYLNEEIKLTEQKHEEATYCEKIQKSDGEISLSGDPEKNLRKIRAFESSVGTYFFDDFKGAQKRVKVKEAHLESGLLIIDRVIPEGGKEMDYSSYLRGKN